MKKRLLYLLLFTATLYAGCSNNNIEHNIGKKIQDECKTDSCTLVMAQIVKFKWDKMYVFNAPVSLEVINQALGVKYPYYVEFTRPIIFMNGSEIVHYENNKSNVESLIAGQVIFDYPDSLKYQVYTPKKSTFKVMQKKFNDGVYYKLYQ
ncbi:hypothetical protein [Mucilaginibacter flavus]|uniref:hypothetical protein n=1 Tax=Mucilaginibacter flavus TaxID=931504 RepID=UPI0025B40A1D|nr:hypothetical protein [Mucilaginibacter flavus]MDN3583835.1 hypothetical protein [Mucilaginibacter flavus]